MSALRDAGELAALEAERLWNLDVFDPPIGSKNPRAAMCLAIIDGIITRAGWGFATPYRGNGPPQWCGLFAADCWRAAGIDLTWLATYFASTYRLMLWVNYKRFSSEPRYKQNPPPPSGVERRLLVEIVNRNSFSVIEPQRGDIVIVGDGDPECGDHITINMGYDAKLGAFDTISGNGGGVGPKGDKREGISRRTYTIGSVGYRPMWLIRTAPGDLYTIH
jgi:hypothetical protein